MECPCCWWVHIAVVNRGTNLFSRKCFWRDFSRQVAVEIFDKKGLLYREDLTGIQNGVLSRDNTFVLPPRITGYPAGPGWDPVTGWGTPDARVLVPLLAGR